MHEDFKIKFHMLSKERVELFKKIKELEEINLKRGQSEQSLSLLTQNLNENPFYKAKPGLGLFENQTLRRAPSNLYDFHMMSAAKPTECASGGNVYEIFVRPTSTSEQSSDETESTSTPSCPTSIEIVEFPNEFKSDWEKIKASTPNASVAPIDYENLNATYATRIIETPREEFVGPPIK